MQEDVWWRGGGVIKKSHVLLFNPIKDTRAVVRR